MSRMNCNQLGRLAGWIVSSTRLDSDAFRNALVMISSGGIVMRVDCKSLIFRHFAAFTPFPALDS